MASRYWRCRRVKAGITCGTLNVAKKRLCTTCGKPRPKRRQPAHKAILATMPYDEFVAAYGASCGICGRAAKTGGRRLHRDHDHRTGLPRGVLCFSCNSALRSYMTLDWLRRAVAYLERAERFEWPAHRRETT